MSRIKLAPIALVLMHFTVVILIVVSIAEVWQTIGDIVHTLRKVDGVFLAAALAAALLPAGAVIFWGGKAIVVQLERPIRWMRRYFRHPRDQKGVCDPAIKAASIMDSQ